MSQDHKLSLPAAILININIMLGAGIFINTVELAERAASLGGFAYLLVGTLLLPLIISIAYLVNMYPEGGFYAFAQKEINPFIGFISSWSYFTGKLASATLMIHASVLLIQQLIPTLAVTHPLILDGCILSIFIILNMLNIKTGSYIQIVFMGLKSIPITFAILTGLFLIFGSGAVATPNFAWTGIPSSLPLVLYAVTGFEASCSLSSKIKDAHKNGPLAIFISYGILVLIAFLYQTIFYTSLGIFLANIPSYLLAFPLLTEVLLPFKTEFAHRLNTILHIAIASSALGGAYGIIFSNNWNLYILAKNKHIFFQKFFTTLNTHAIPFACVLAEGLICATYFVITQGATVSLQQVAALGCILAYTLSVLALFIAKKNRPTLNISILVPTFGLVNCALLIAACLKNFFTSGLIPLIAFTGLLAIGTIMFFITKKTNEVLTKLMQVKIAPKK